MGFGIALASGFLKGINQNINLEKARVAKEDATIDGFQTQLNKAVLDSDGTNLAGINAVKKQLQSARQQQQNREPIDMFGRAGKKINMGIIDTASLMNTTLQSPVPMGSFVLTDKVLKDYNKPSASAEDKASMFFTALEKKLFHPDSKVRDDTINNIMQNPRTLQAVKKQWQKHVTYMLVARSGILNKATDGGSATVNFDPRTDIPSYDMMSKILNITPNFEFNQMAQLANTKSNGEFNTSNSLLVRVNGENGETLTKFQPFSEFIENANYDSQFKDETKFKEALNGIAAIHGNRYKSGAEWLYSHNYKTKPLLKGEDVQNKFYQSLNHTMELFALNAHKARSGADTVAIGKYFADNNIFDPFEQARIIQPLIKKENLELSNIYEQHGVPARGTKTKKEWWSQNYGTSLKDTRLASDAVDSGLLDLKRLKKIVQELPQAGGSLLEKGASLYFGFVGEGSQGEQISNMIKSANGMGGGGYFTKGGVETTDMSLQGIIEKDLAKRKGQGLFRASIGEKISAADVLRYTIAAKLARAEDPAGRLSNQDFERQLIKLGATKSFGNKKMEIAAIDEVIREFSNKQKNFIAIKGIIDSGSNYFTSDDRSFLTANLYARSAESAYESNLYSTTEGATLERDISSADFNKLIQPAANAESTIMPSGYIVTATGTSVYQDKSAPEGGIKQFYLPQPNGNYRKISISTMRNLDEKRVVSFSSVTGNPTSVITGGNTGGNTGSGTGGGTGGGGQKLTFPSNITGMGFVSQTGGIYTTPNHPNKTFKLIGNNYVEQ